MPPDWDEDYWNELSNEPANGKQIKPNGASQSAAPSVTLRPPLYNAEDYTAALKQHFSTHGHHHRKSVLIDHTPSSSPGNGHGHGSNGNGHGYYEKNVTAVAAASGNHNHSHNTPNSNTNKSYMDHLLPDTPPEMSMRKFLNGSELLFKLEADLRHAYPTFVQEFVSGQSEGVACLLEALKVIQASIDNVTGLREQRKLFMDELKCLHCIRLCLRNIEAVSKLAAYPGGLYPLASAMISTVTTTRIIALEILTCVCSEGGGDGHFKVSEAISTLRLRMGEPIRCKLLVGAISSAPPGTFQAKGIKFITAWVSSASSPKQKVHIQCELEEAGFNPQSLRKGAELGGARESREVQAELDAWSNVAIDVDTLTRQNGQLRNSVATLQQELATLKDKIKKMDVPSKEPSASSVQRSSGGGGPSAASQNSNGHGQGHAQAPTNNLSAPKPKPAPRAEELVTTPVDSEEEAEQIHQILEDLNNIVNSEMNQQQPSNTDKKVPPGGRVKKGEKKEKEIVPMNLVKPPPKKTAALGGREDAKGKGIAPLPRPWPTSSASEDYDEDDDNDSDIIQAVNSNGSEPKSKNKNVVRQVIEQIEQQQQQKQMQSNDAMLANGNNGNGKLYRKHQSSSPKPKSSSPIGSVPVLPHPPAAAEPKPDYYNPLPNFHKQNHMANKFVNFKSSKLYSSSPDNSLTGIIAPNLNLNHNQSGKSLPPYQQLPIRISPTLEKVQRKTANILQAHQQQQTQQAQRIAQHGQNHGQLRRSESLHTSLTSIIFPRKESREGLTKEEKKLMKWNKMEVEKWKSVDSLHNVGHSRGEDEQRSNFTLKWKYPGPQVVKSYPSLNVTTTTPSTSPKSDDRDKKKVKRSSKTSGGKSSPGTKEVVEKKSSSSSSNNADSSGNSNGVVRGVFELYTDYRQSRFTSSSSANNSPKQSNKIINSNSNGNHGSSPTGFFSRYSKKASSNIAGGSSGSGGSNSSANSDVLGIIPHYENKKRGKKMLSKSSSNHCINIDTSANQHHNHNSIMGSLNHSNGNGISNGKDPQSITMFSLPPIFVSQGIDLANHRICDLPSGLY